MIPNTIHRIWVGGPMPAVFDRFGDLWRQFHPGWRVIDWTDSAALPPMVNAKLVDRAAEIYPGDWKRFTADLVRLELLWHYGGVYVDTDTEPRRHVGGMLDGRECVVGRSPQASRGVHALTNAVIAAEPQHPYIGELIVTLPDAIRRYGHLPLARSVGPWHLNRVYESGDWPEVTVLGHAEMYGHWVHHTWNTAAVRRGGGVR